jgi:hypothetical protein
MEHLLGKIAALDRGAMELNSYFASKAATGALLKVT